MNRNKFTLIAWDPPGYGFSRPPERDYSLGMKLFQSDADLAAALMAKLGYSSYSVMGWSDGGRTGLLMAISYPSRVDKLVIWGAVHLVTDRQKQVLEAGRNVDLWDDDKLTLFRTAYGNEVQNMWNNHVDFYKVMGDFCGSTVHKIMCPTFILHGGKDGIEREHVDYLVRTIGDSQFHLFPEGRHNIHMTYVTEFNRMVTRFLDD
jgi:valacyclovir hydrolase